MSATWRDVGAAQAVTLDVFDTALTRRWALPQHLFLRCAEALRDAGLITIDDEAWMQLRRRAEQQVIARRGEGMAGVSEVYAELAAAQGWSPASAQRAQAIELAAEHECLRPVPSVHRLWLQLRQSPRRRRFLSDMYLGEPQVAELLAAAGYPVDDDEVWVSADRQASKRDGSLFRLALAAWPDLLPGKVFHLGDHVLSDVLQARRHGLVAQAFDDTRLPQPARALLALDHVPLRLRSLVAGAMRLAWLARPDAGEDACGHDAALWQLGSAHAGPLLSLYVWWLLLDAEQRGVRRLYFLARDGQVLLQIARVLQASGCAPGIELRYLHASRQAWFAPSIVRWDEASLTRLLDEPDRLAVPGKLARRLGFADETALHGCWPDLLVGLPSDASNQHLARHVLQRIAPESALRHTAELRAKVLGYLRQQGLYDGTEWAVVDLGWRGRLQEALLRMLRTEAPQAQARGYYIQLSEEPMAGSEGWHAHTFCGRAATPGPAHLLELLCEADHGSTRAYDGDAGQAIRPVCEPDASAPMQSWGLATYRRAVGAYAVELAAAMPLLGSLRPERADLLALAQAIGRELFGRPPADVARALASIPCSYSANHDETGVLACGLSRADAWMRAVSLGRLQLGRAHSHWLPGSLARSPSPRAYATYLQLHRLADRVRRRWASMALRTLARVRSQ